MANPAIKMSAVTSLRIYLAISILSISLVQSQIIADLPLCVKDCVERNSETTCILTDISCFCRATAGRFLTNVVTCAHGNCKTELDIKAITAPMKHACEVAGLPIPDSILLNVENQSNGWTTPGGRSSSSVSTTKPTATHNGSIAGQVYATKTGSPTIPSTAGTLPKTGSNKTVAGKTSDSDSDQSNGSPFQDTTSDANKLRWGWLVLGISMSMMWGWL